MSVIGILSHSTVSIKAAAGCACNLQLLLSIDSDVSQQPESSMPKTEKK